MNTPRVDLNLLTVLHAIMAEGSVTRAARRLSMTQPAVSNALRRARVLFKDDLFTKEPGGIRPTELAIALWPDLDQSLKTLNGMIHTQDFRPENTEVTVRLAITDSLLSAVAPVLTKRFTELAPKSKLHLQPHTNAGSIHDLEQGRLDCAIGMFPNPPNALKMESLLRDQYVCAMRADHPTALDLTLDRFTSERHILVKQAPQQRGFVDIWLELNGRQRSIVAILNRCEDALALVETSDLLAAIPHRFVQSYAKPSVTIRPLPFQAEQLVYKMLWHERTDKSAPQLWFRQLLRDVFDIVFGGHRLSLVSDDLPPAASGEWPSRISP